MKTKKKLPLMIATILLLQIALPMMSVIWESDFTIKSVAADEVLSGDWTYTVNEDGNTITITKYSGTDADLVIPNEIDNYTVTIIGHWAFCNCKNLQTVEIPEGIISINSDAFIYCEALKSINVEENNKNYSSQNGVLFNKDKTYLKKYPRGKDETQYVIPSTVTTIESYAFYECDNLKNIEIPSGVTHIWGSAFEDCSNLINIDVDENNQNYSSDNGVFFNKEKTNLIVYPANKEGTEYVIPNTVKTIESNSFEYCKNLISIEIPKGIIHIGSFAFNGCSSLKNITIPKGLTKIYGYTFLSCKSLISIEIPDTVTYIETWAFTGCDSLASIKIPSSVTIIEEEAFRRCNNLTIICNNNSKAKQYAIDNDIPYIFSGDANGDGKVDFMDILAINKHRLGKSQLTGMHLEAADVNEDGKVDFMDILQINKYRLGKIDSL